MSDYAKLRVLSLHWQGIKVPAIAEYLVLEDGIRFSKTGIRRFLKRFADLKTIARKAGSGCPPKISPVILQLIDRAMHADDETTATQLQALLASHNVYVSLSTIVRNRCQMGWIYRGSAYRQFIRDVNKQKRYDFDSHLLTSTIHLMTLYGAMKQPFNWKPTGVDAIAEKMRGLC